MNRQSFVSVVVTTYNQAPYLAAALDSVLGQSYRHREVIVVDDGSTDTTPQVLDRFRGKILTVCQGNEGVAAARNTGVRHARGEFVALPMGMTSGTRISFACKSRRRSRTRSPA